jgi:Putative beta barrel porin-7 (BBP7)
MNPDVSGQSRAAENGVLQEGEQLARSNACKMRRISMRNGFLGSVAALLASAGLAFAQAPYYYGVPYGSGPLMQPYYSPAPGYYGSAATYAPGYVWPTAQYQPSAVPSRPRPAAPVQPVNTQSPESLPNTPPETPLADSRPTPGTIEGPPTPTPPLPGTTSSNLPNSGAAPAAAPLAEGTAEHDEHSLLGTVAGPSCGGGIDGCASGHCASPAGLRIWTTAEFLGWTIKDQPISVPLLTTGNIAAATAVGLPPGAIGAPGTTVISPSSIQMSEFSGGRLNIGGWLTADCHIGVEASGFILAQQTKTFGANSGTDGNTVLAVPALLLPANVESVIPTAVSLPGANTLTASIVARSQLYGAESNFLFHIYNNDWFSIGGLAGGRYLDLTEDLSFNTTLTGDPANGVPPNGLVGVPGFTIAATDRWATRDQFIGPQIGTRAEVRFWRLFANVEGKVAFGNMHETVNLTGATGFTGIAGGLIETGGHFNLVTNISHETKDQFAVVPEVQAQLGIEFSRNLRAFAGYDFLYINDVVRPGDQINRYVNPAALPPILIGSTIVPAMPSKLFETSTFWAQGITAGIEVRY